MSMWSQQVIQEGMLKNCLVFAEQGPKQNKSINASQFVRRGNGTVDFQLPGFFASSNPIKYSKNIDYKKQVEDAFPQPSYYSSILTNDANSLFVFPAQNLQPQQVGINNEIGNRQQFNMREPLKSQVLTDNESIAIFY